MDHIIQAVERAIDTMQNRLGDNLTIDDLAHSAMFSKFHFSRVFQRTTGVSPGRFLSAMRLAEAKRLLLTTSITVADIGHQVGYNSVGTFSSRFRSSVGVSPITYRQLGGVATRIPDDGRYTTENGTTVVRGRVHGPHGVTLGSVFLGVFPHRVPEGVPAGHTVLGGPGPYQLPKVPAGTWYLVAYATGAAADGAEVRYVSCSGPFPTEAGTAARLVDVRLRPESRMDPPLLLALPDLDGPAELDLAV
ncbi:MAG TPA: helix-turn-helix transcriptional regulator [Pseudonocardiaceae bacterium]|jgi:AraC-like DNA-binding protein|nr:helix-turn-helix transcriptional regulator [Pseudonocardiaceae bacterium]